MIYMSNKKTYITALYKSFSHTRTTLIYTCYIVTCNLGSVLPEHTQ
jgi:hypothetical protein